MKDGEGAEAFSWDWMEIVDKSEGEPQSGSSAINLIVLYPALFILIIRLYAWARTSMMITLLGWLSITK
jgi:hypothetical protein